MIDVQCRRKIKIGVGFTEVKPPFNHNNCIMPNINTSVDDLLLKSDGRFDFTTDRLNDTCVRGKIEERSAGRSPECSTSFRTSHFTPKY
ncbi:hypothetical protein R6Q57_008447 [Mikania cordata]